MRLLTYDESGTLVFHIVNDSNNPPAYATLSHSWHVDDSQEVNFHDVKTSRGTPKPVFRKIHIMNEPILLCDGIELYQPCSSDFLLCDLVLHDTKVIEHGHVKIFGFIHDTTISSCEFLGHGISPPALDLQECNTSLRFLML